MFFRVIKWSSAAFLIVTVIGYNAFVHWRYSKLPDNLLPSSAEFSPRVRQIYWYTEFGPDPMEMRPFPFWKVLMALPHAFRNHGEMPAGFNAASILAKNLLSANGPRPRTLEAHFDVLFAAIWITKHWSVEEIVNTLLDRIYFCHEFYGIDGAAEGYFGLSPDELTNEELVMLSGISRRPCAFSPWLQRSRLESRAEAMLRKVSRMGIFPVDVDADESIRRLRGAPWQLDIGAKLISNGRYNLPDQVQIAIRNDSRESIRIYRPDKTYLFLWDLEVEYENAGTKRFRQRIDMPWFESEPVSIEAREIFMDTISILSPSDFYGDENRKAGCNPFRKAERARFIYTFPGHKLPSGNLQGIMIEEDVPLKYQTIAGTFFTNWVEIGEIDFKKIAQDSADAAGIEDRLARMKAQAGLPRFDCSEGG